MSVGSHDDLPLYFLEDSDCHDLVLISELLFVSFDKLFVVLRNYG